MPCDRPESCLDCPELHAEISRRGTREAGLFWCPVAAGEKAANKAVA